MLILHYHIFKNAGTSVDVMLHNNFGSQWAEVEFAEALQGEPTNWIHVAAYLNKRTDLAAISSHTAQLPLPQIDRVILPILFVRHPLDRLMSAYSFERLQQAETHGARLAKKHDFVGYIQHLLADTQFRQARNFQTQRLADFEPPERGSELERALRALDALPFVGLVEEYGRSIDRLAALITPHYPGFRSEALHENRTPGQLERLDDRIAKIKTLLPEVLLENLMQANTNDFTIYEKVKSWYL